MAAEVIAIEGIYFAAAKRLRERGRMAAATRQKDAALQLRKEAWRLEGLAHNIARKSNALARHAAWQELL